MYDYLIVGGGLAGSMLGYLLKKNGYDVVILEKQILNKKSKLCGGIITPKTYSLLTTEFSKKDIDNIVKTKFKNCCCRKRSKTIRVKTGIRHGLRSRNTSPRKGHLS